MGGACELPGRGEKCIQFLIRKPESKEPLGRLRYRWEGSGFIWHKRGMSGRLL